MNKLCDSYLGDKILTCPADKTGNKTWLTFGDINEAKLFSYTYNRFLGYDLNSYDLPMLKISRVKNPSLCHMQADGGTACNYHPDYTNFFNGNYFNACHMGQGNFLFVDGHVNGYFIVKDQLEIKSLGKPE